VDLRQFVTTLRRHLHLLIITEGGDGLPAFHSIMEGHTTMAIMVMAITGLAPIPTIEAGTAGKE